MNHAVALITILVNILILFGCSSKTAAERSPSSADSIAAPADSTAAITLLPADDSLPFVDLTKSYPLKKINLREVADINYVRLELTDRSLVGSVMNLTVGDGKIIFKNPENDEILVFNMDGTFLTGISRRGAGPHEYRSLGQNCVDLANGLIYIMDPVYTPQIKAYDFDRYMQKKLDIPYIPSPDAMSFFDENRIIVHYDADEATDPDNTVGSYPYRVIDTRTGKITPLRIELPDRISPTVRKISGNQMRMSTLPMRPMLRSNNRVVISDYAYPIVYMQQGTRLKPLIRKSDCRKSDHDKQETLSVVKFITDRYIVFQVVKRTVVDRDECIISIDGQKEILYNRQTGEVCEVDFINPDTGKPLFLDTQGDLPGNTIAVVYPSFILETLKEKGSLTGELKEIAAKMDPDDNPVLAIITFR